jgi:hypothetical protein
VLCCCAQALQELSPAGHGVFLKTNWSAPKDASFLIGARAAAAASRLQLPLDFSQVLCKCKRLQMF